MSNPSVVRVHCRASDCGAEYEQRLPAEVCWSDALYDAALPKQCGVCGCKRVGISNVVNIVRV